MRHESLKPETSPGRRFSRAPKLGPRWGKRYGRTTPRSASWPKDTRAESGRQEGTRSPFRSRGAGRFQSDPRPQFSSPVSSTRAEAPVPAAGPSVPEGGAEVTREGEAARATGQERGACDQEQASPGPRAGRGRCPGTVRAARACSPSCARTRRSAPSRPPAALTGLSLSLGAGGAQGDAPLAPALPALPGARARPRSSLHINEGRPRRGRGDCDVALTHVPGFLSREGGGRAGGTRAGLGRRRCPPRGAPGPKSVPQAQSRCPRLTGFPSFHHGRATPDPAAP